MKRFYRLVRFLPYLILLLLAAVFLIVRNNTSDSLLQTLSVNLAGSAIFIVIAYFFYDLVKTWIRKGESRYIDQYIRSQISFDVFVVLYTLKKYIHGYNLDTNAISYILDICSYSEEQIYRTIRNQSYLGFQIFRGVEDLKDLFREALQSNVVSSYGDREYIISLLKIVTLLSEIEHLFRSENSYSLSPEKSIDFFFVDGREINAKNEEGLFLLLRKTEHPNRAVVYDSGRFETSDIGKLLNKYTLKDEAAQILSEKIRSLNKELSYWIPRQQQIPKASKRHRIINGQYSSFSCASAKGKGILVGDVIEAESEKGA